MSKQKTDRRSPEQIAYDEANAAYQDAWKADRPIREACNKAAEKILTAGSAINAMGLLDAYFSAYHTLQRREARTAELLAAREEAYKALVAAQAA
jgi:hypothetical protein